ncbi:ABC transporter permease [candidate division KSB1 bacterium]|nr:ABC transporter permease [candidate division KSB1 bacterium]
MRIFIYIWEGIRIAFEALKSYKLRSVLTTLGIIIGVMTVITIVALVQGLNKAFTEQISAIGTDTLHIDKYPWMAGEKWFEYRNRRNITLEDAIKVKQMAKLAVGVTPALYTRRVVKYRDKTLEGVTIVGTTEDYIITSNTYPEFGRFLMKGDVDYRRPICVLGWEVSQKLFPNTDPMGKRVSISGRKFRVVGIIEKKGKMFDENMDTYAYVPIGNFQAAFGARWRSVGIQVKVKSPEVMEDAEIELTGIMRRIRGLEPGEKDDFSINKQSMLMDMYKKLTTVLWAVAIGVGSISLLVGGIGIMNILLVSVTERTREIGVRKALGARRLDIMVQFLIESMMICAVGVTCGILLAVGLAELVAATTPLPAAITPWVAFLGLGFVVTIGLFFGIYPASKAAKLNPIEALRYE